MLGVSRFARRKQGAQACRVKAPENVHWMLQEAQPLPLKGPVHHSKHCGAVAVGQFEMGVRRRRAGASFGRACGAYTPRPSAFLRGHSQAPLPPPGPPTRKRCVRCAPAEGEPEVALDPEEQRAVPLAT
ncbi:hypothetical protein WJX81_007233 [Elliptochloris bilobata]|uniref:Uncharacterized protein n=1 Tax=Elliptochloris bilobata TaxID=381761 RepID=A0AAW1SF06_9CHLO